MSSLDRLPARDEVAIGRCFVAGAGGTMVPGWRFVLRRLSVLAGCCSIALPAPRVEREIFLGGLEEMSNVGGRYTYRPFVFCIRLRMCIGSQLERGHMQRGAQGSSSLCRPY